MSSRRGSCITYVFVPYRTPGRPPSSVDECRGVSTPEQRRRVPWRVDTVDGHPCLLHKRVKYANGFSPAAYTGDNRIGQSSPLVVQLGFDFASNDALKAAHERRKRVRTNGRTNNVVRRLDVRDPVPNRFVQGILERLGPARDGNHFYPQHLHAKDIERLALRIDIAHVHDTVETEQGTRRGRGHTMLPRSRLGNNARLAKPLGQHGFPQCIFNLVGARVGQVLAFEPNLLTLRILREPTSVVQRRRTANIVPTQVLELLPKARVLRCLHVRVNEVMMRLNERLGDKTATKLPKVGYWMNDIRQYSSPTQMPAMLLVGNKIDLPNLVLTLEEGEAAASQYR
ncbi:hypothetical protein PsorP6_010249 [Peronosclerospora sorghi]|uniref:Uncharacterized protein n=1 Tax=Peronosclerospora sorghi TaxID=230839 RepID=A0ACC0VXL4_9STRA|nr:hypothetical protein PsorP6_010249 [Peronosclerospora sorghi]